MANSLVVYVCLITNTFVRLGEAEKKVRYFVKDMDSSGLVTHLMSKRIIILSISICCDPSQPKNHKCKKKNNNSLIVKGDDNKRVCEW